jgi:hypothetical protein
MTVNMRREAQNPSKKAYSITSTGDTGVAISAPLRPATYFAHSIVHAGPGACTLPSETKWKFAIGRAKITPRSILCSVTLK